MSHLLRSAATKSSITIASRSRPTTAANRSFAFVSARLPTSHHRAVVADGSTAAAAVATARDAGQAMYRQIGMRYPDARLVATLQSSRQFATALHQTADDDASATEDDGPHHPSESDDERPPAPAGGDDDNDDDGATTETTQRKKKKSRKQRIAKAKAINLQRVDKVLAHRGVGSRSETFALAKAGRIKFADKPDAPHSERTRVLGPKHKVPFGAALFLDGKLVPGPPPLLLAYHKPKRMLSVMEDEVRYRDRLRRKHLGQVLDPKYAKAGMHPVGRLDYDTTGLILFSMDGTLTQRLLHPRRGVEKEYVATVRGEIDEAELTRKLSDGVKTSEGVHTADLISVSPSDGPAPADYDDEDDGDLLEELMGLTGAVEVGEDGEKEVEVEVEMPIPAGDGGSGDDFLGGRYSDVRLVVREGKHRMVRRMLANCGHPVVELRRERHGEIELGNLGVGEFRHATEMELEWARSLIE